MKAVGDHKANSGNKHPRFAAESNVTNRSQILAGLTSTMDSPHHGDVKTKRSVSVTARLGTVIWDSPG